MPIIEMPDGTELEFPEGMDRGKMREAIRSKYSSGNETGGDELIATAGTGAPHAIPAESPPTKRQLLDAGIKESQKQSKYYTGKANALDFAERALDVPGAFKSLINLPNRLTGQPDYPALVSPEQVQKVGEFLNPLAPGALPQDEVTQGLLKGGAQTVSGLTSPDVAAAALLAKKYPVPVSTLFAGETLGAIPEATRSLLESKTPGEAAERAVPTAANLLLTKLLANHLIGKGPVIPKTGPPTDIPSEAAPAVEAAEPAPPAPPASVTTATLDRLEAEGKTPNEIQKEGVGSQVAGEISKSIEAVREAQPEGEIPGPVALADESKVVPLKSESEAPLAQQPFPAGPELLERALPGTDPFKSFSDALKAWKLSVGDWLKSKPENRAIVWTEPKREFGAVFSEELPSDVMTEKEISGWKDMSEVDDPSKLVWYKTKDTAEGLTFKLRGTADIEKFVRDSFQNGRIAFTEAVDPATEKYLKLEREKPSGLPQNGNRLSPAKASQEFDRLIVEQGLQLDWIDKPDALFAEIGKALDTASIKAKLAKGKALQAARRKAAGDLGLKPDDVDTVAGRAKALDVLKKHIEERNAPDTSPETGNEDTSFLPAEKPAQVIPKLRPGEKGTGDLLQGEDAPFNLAGETAVDTERVAREKADAAKKAAEAKAAQEKQQPGLTGIGGAVPGEFEGENNFVSNMFAAIDRDRAQMGKEPMLDTQRRSWDEDNQKALARMNRNPQWIPDLITEVTKSPRPLLSWENAGMVWQRHLWKAEANNALARIAQAFDDGRTADLESAKLDAARYEEKLEALDKAVGRNGTGSEAGRSLQAQKMAGGEDFTLVEMRLEARKSLGGRPLTEAESAEIKSLHDKLARNEIDITAARGRIAQLEIEKAAAEARAQPSYSPGVLQQAERFVKKLESGAEDSAKWLREHMGRTSAGVDPTVLYHVTKLGAAKFARGAIELAKWTDAMAAEVGEWVRDKAQEWFEASKKLHDEQLGLIEKAQGKVFADKVKKAVTDIPGRIDAAKASIKGKVDKGESAIAGDVQKLFKAVVEQNPSMTARQLADTMHGILKESLPDITWQETIDAISGRGKFWRPSQEALAKTVRDKKAQLRLIGHQMDVEARKPLPRTGYQPDKMTDIARQEAQRLEELKRRYGVVVTNPATQLASALQSRKTYYIHRLADLKAEIASRTRIVKTSSKVSDPALEALKAEYEKVKAEHNSIFNKELSDESKLKAATSAAERNLAEWNAKLEKAKRGDFSRDPAKPKLSTPALETIRAKADAARNEIEHLKDLDTAFQEQKQIKALEDSIAEYNRRIKENDLATSKKAGVSSPKIEALKAKRTALAEKLAALKASTPEAKAAKIEAARKSIQESIEALSQQINEGDIAAKPKAGPTVTSPELEQMRGERDQLLKIKQQLQNAAKPKKSPLEIAIQARKTAIAREIAELQDRIAKSDFSPKPKRTIVPDSQLTTLQTQKARLVKEFRQKLLANEMANRSRGRRVADLLLRIRREFILSGISSIGKLFSYSAQEFALAPLKEAVGGVLSKVPGISRIAERAPSEIGQRGLGSEVKGMINDYVAAFTKGIKDAKDTWARGESELKARLDPAIRPEAEFRAFFGTLHQMEKSPLIRFGFERSFRRRMESAVDRGLDVSDVGVQQRIAVDAYQDALRGALINRNAVVNRVNRFITSLEEKSKTTGRTPALATAAKFAFSSELPVQHVPANYVARTAEYIFGLGTGSAKAAMAFRRGIETLQPAEADQIMRHLKSGAVGSAAMLTGFLLPKLFGGLWTPGGKKNDQLKPGEIQAGPVKVRYWATHEQVLNAAQFGATVRKISETKHQGLSAGAQAALWGLADEVPYARELSDFAKAKDPRMAGKFWEEKAKGYLIPQGVSQLAELLDMNEQWRTVKRTPHNVGQALESGIPGLRQNVPTH